MIFFFSVSMFIYISFIIGHSFGAYVGASYAMNFSSRVFHLILVSPVGVPREPLIPNAPRGTRAPFIWRLTRFMWSRGYTPQSIVRLIGPMGSRPVTTYVTRRYFLGPAVEAPPPASEAGLETSA